MRPFAVSFAACTALGVCTAAQAQSSDRTAWIADFDQMKAAITAI